MRQPWRSSISRTSRNSRRWTPASAVRRHGSSRQNSSRSSAGQRIRSSPEVSDADNSTESTRFSARRPLKRAGASAGIGRRLDGDAGNPIERRPIIFPAAGSITGPSRLSASAKPRTDFRSTFRRGRGGLEGCPPRAAVSATAGHRLTNGDPWRRLAGIISVLLPKTPRAAEPRR
jgi:hypothetical protein